MLDKSKNFRSKSFFWCSRSKSVDRYKWTEDWARVTGKTGGECNSEKKTG
jgi:hypothetical protein